MSEAGTDRERVQAPPAGAGDDPAVPRPEPAPAEADRPQPEPADTEPPQGDPLRSGEDATRHGHPDDDAERGAAAGTAAGAGGADVPPVAASGASEDPVATAEARAAEYLELAQRKQAEFENFRRRMNLQVAQAEDRGVAKLAKELLPALDHLELALEAAEKHESEGEWLKGIRLVQEELIGALSRVGIQAFAPFGEPFDPNEHEAMAQQPVAEGQEPGTVTQVYQAGYRINGAVLRPARVVVAQ